MIHIDTNSEVKWTTGDKQGLLNFKKHSPHACSLKYTVVYQKYKINEIQTEKATNK